MRISSSGSGPSHGPWKAFLLAVFLLLGAACSAGLPEAPSSLVGSRWLVVAYRDGADQLVSVVPGSITTAQFGEDGLLQGTMACGLYSAPYRLEGAALSIGEMQVFSTGPDCPEAAVVQDRQLLAALTTAASCQIERQILQVYAGDGSTVANLEYLQE